MTTQYLNLSPTDTFVLHLFEMGAFNEKRAPKWPSLRKSNYWIQEKDKVWLTSAGMLRGAELRSDMEDVMFCLVLPSNKCKICGRELERGITIQKHEDGFAHPECILGVPIDYGD